MRAEERRDQEGRLNVLRMVAFASRRSFAIGGFLFGFFYALTMTFLPLSGPWDVYFLSAWPTQIILMPLSSSGASDLVVAQFFLLSYVLNGLLFAFVSMCLRFFVRGLLRI